MPYLPLKPAIPFYCVDPGSTSHLIISPLSYYHIVFSRGCYLDLRIIFLHLQGLAYTQLILPSKGLLEREVYCAIILHWLQALHFVKLCSFLTAHMHMCMHQSSGLDITYIDDICIQLARTGKKIPLTQVLNSLLTIH